MIFCQKTLGRGCKYNPHSEFNLRGRTLMRLCPFKSWKKGNFTPQYIMHRKEELGMQSGDLTKLLVEFSRYAQTFLDALANESKTASLIKTEGTAGDANHKVLKVAYQSWLQRSFDVNKILEGRLVFISGLLESLKKDLTTLQVSQMELDVQERARQVAARRYKKQVEDVRDYDDLEGQYAIVMMRTAI